MMGIIWTIIIGGVAGWLASNFMKGKSLGLMWNIILGIGGAWVGKLTFSLIGMSSKTLLSDLLVATVGAVIVLFVANKLKK